MPLIDSFSEETYRRIVESAPNAFVMVDTDGAIVFVNARAESLFGYERHELIGRPVEILVPERFRAAHPSSRRAFARDPSTRAMGAGRDLYGVRKDGREIPVEIGLNPIRTDRGAFVLGSIVDITERKRLDARLREAAADLARSNTDLEQFAYVASHDLQEPLRMVSSFLELLASKYQGRLDADADRYIGYAVDGAKRMHAMIGDLLAFSRAGRTDGANVSVSCDAALAAALANLSKVVTDTGAEIFAEPLPHVRGSAPQLTQVFQNLIENSLKYRSEAPPRIRVSAERGAETHRLTIRDNGIGIDPRFSERIFRVFQRLHDRSKYAGTGIGLAVVKRIVERHGGEIRVESEVGKGAAFHVTLPAASEGAS